MLVAGSNAHHSLIRLHISCTDSLEALQEPHYDIARFSGYEGVCRADPWPAPERNKLPHRPDVLPTLRAELLCVLPPDVRVSVHQISVAVDNVALLDEDGRFAVRTPANR